MIFSAGNPDVMAEMTSVRQDLTFSVMPSLSIMIILVVYSSQQETREKLEVFPKLGYHFIVFRAIKSYEERMPYTLNRSSPTVPTSAGVIDEVYVYLVVFKDGICSFHFSDLSGAFHAPSACLVSSSNL